ncbi:MAG: prepilin-type N-terminal cleavage/methylation domain-containing protein [Deltaproteobacteria bacterium]|nr:prepilin-type N-terminal cleavage/methylation domain-containing protein [Deltaproteobacteria bacterium]
MIVTRHLLRACAGLRGGLKARRRACTPARSLRPQPRRRSRGFTLLEVTVAVAVMGVGIVGALELFTGSMKLAGEVDNQTKAVVLARSLVDESMWRTVLQEETRSGNQGKYSWTLETRPIDRQLLGLDESSDDKFRDAEGELGLWQISAEVRWLGTNGEKSVVVQSARISEKSS